MIRPFQTAFLTIAMACTAIAMGALVDMVAAQDWSSKMTRYAQSDARELGVMPTKAAVRAAFKKRDVRTGLEPASVATALSAEPHAQPITWLEGVEASPRSGKPLLAASPRGPPDAIGT
jgi:hypothetical protein